MGFLTSTSGDSDESFNENIRMVKNKIAGMGLKLRIPSFLQEVALRQSSPFDTCYESITEISNRNMSLSALFKGLPFSRKWFDR